MNTINVFDVLFLIAVLGLALENIRLTNHLRMVIGFISSITVKIPKENESYTDLGIVDGVMYVITRKAYIENLESK